MAVAGARLWLCAPAALGLLALAGPAAPHPARATTCTPIAPTSLSIVSSTDDARDKIVWTSRDHSVDLLIDDPTATTTRVELLDADGTVLVAATTPANASGWRAGGRPTRRWTYTARRDPNAAGGIESIRSTHTSFRFRGRGAALDEVRAPLPLPITMRLSTGSRCFEARFEACRTNTESKIRCRSRCSPSALLPAAGADRVLSLDLRGSAPWLERLRGFNLDIMRLEGCVNDPASGEDCPGVCERQPGESTGECKIRRGLELADRIFGTRPGRAVRVWFKPSHWPAEGFDASCKWRGQPKVLLDQVISSLVSSGAVVELTLFGQPAAFSSDCAGSCSNRMLPGNGCTCNTSGDGFAFYVPRDYGPEWQQHWKCVLAHYAALGVRRFEIWNEPDIPAFFPSRSESQFIEMFEQMRLALEAARDGLDPALREGIEIGGPAMSRVDATIGGGSVPSLVPLVQNIAAGPGDADVDFLSAHYYTDDPGHPFAADKIGFLRGLVPPSWPDVHLDINEWNIGLGHQIPCQDADGDPTNGWQAPEAGKDSSAGCDHRGAGYGAYMLAGFAASSGDVRPYVFEPLIDANSERCDMLETGLGIMTRHGLPKPMAAVHWAVSQMEWRLLGAAQERLTDRSIGWIAALDREQTVHVLVGQFDSSPLDHFSRAYAAAGYDSSDLFVACGCGPGEFSQCGCGSGPGGTCTTAKECVSCKIAAAAADPDPEAALSAACPGLTAAEVAAVLDAWAGSRARVAVEHTPATVTLELEGLSCKRRWRVEVFTIGPGQSTAAVWRAMEGPHRTASACTHSLAAEMDKTYDWVAIQDALWDVIRTPTATYRVRSGEPFPLVTVPAYGAVYIRVR